MDFRALRKTSRWRVIGGSDPITGGGDRSRGLKVLGLQTRQGVWSVGGEPRAGKQTGSTGDVALTDVMLNFPKEPTSSTVRWYDSALRVKLRRRLYWQEGGPLKVQKPPKLPLDLAAAFLATPLNILHEQHGGQKEKKLPGALIRYVRGKGSKGNPHSLLPESL